MVWSSKYLLDLSTKTLIKAISKVARLLLLSRIDRFFNRHLVSYPNWPQKYKNLDGDYTIQRKIHTIRILFNVGSHMRAIFQCFCSEGGLCTCDANCGSRYI
ncbi:hypothetical protein Droror1_Dr00009625 [Drosera rotundifolia]